MPRNHTINYKVKIRDGVLISKDNLKYPIYKPIPLILTIGKLAHLAIKGNKLVMYYSFYCEEKKMKLIYALSSKNSTVKNLRAGINEFYNDGKNNQAKIYETLIVNRKLLTLMTRDGWKKDRKSWFIGTYYIK